jgi:hypothetical protein
MTELAYFFAGMAAMGIGNLLAGWHTRAMQLQNERIAAAIIHDAIEHAQQKQTKADAR